MSFHLGKPILAMIGISLLTGTIVLFRHEEPRTDLRVWVFADSHAKSYRDRMVPAASTGELVEHHRWIEGRRPGPGTARLDSQSSIIGQTKSDRLLAPSLLELYQRQTGRIASVNLISARALDVRLISLFNNQSQNVPDLVEVEIGSVGKFFRPPLDQVGFLPLNRFVEREGLMDKMVPSRFAPWSKQGVIFGIPHDLHPVTITYRKDLFDAAGVDLASAKTWDEFQDLCLRFQTYWKQKGVMDRYAIELPRIQSDYLVVMLLQRHLNIVDDYHRVHLGDPKVADTIVRYAQMVAGPRRIAADATPGGDLWAQDMLNGDLCALITPDWRAGFLAERAPSLAGKVAMMPLPRFDPDDAPTSTWGGTMMGIPRTAKDPEASWALLKCLYLSPESLRARHRLNKILPPLKSQWRDPLFHQADPFLAGQKVDELYIDLAEQIPPRYVTPFTPIGSLSLAMVLSNAVAYVGEHANEPREQLEAGLRTACQKWLDREADELRKRIEFGKLE